jgi:hypothetical protein
MKNILCHQTIIIPAWPIELRQNGVNRFTVTYGRQVESGLTYSQAATKYGEAIMHALACEGRLDNREEKPLKS